MSKLAVRTDLYVNGKWMPASGDAAVDVINPATEEIIATVPEATTDDVEAAIVAARHAFDDGPWGRSTPRDRAPVLQAFARRLQERKDDFVELTIAEAGAPRMLAQTGQVQTPFDMFADMVDRVLAGYPFTTAMLPTKGLGVGQGVIVKEAAGVVAAITPFNWPTFVNLSKLGPALAAGCTVVLKPSPFTPLAALLLGEIADEVGLPPGVLNVVTGDLAASQLLTSHPAVDVVTFTGSTSVGAQIMNQASATVKRCVLELGGKSANVVLDDATVERAAVHAARDFTRHAGQGCACLTRVLVHESIHDALVDRMVAELQSLKVGDPNDPSTEMGPVIRESQRQRIEAMIQTGRDEGAQVATGGARPAGLDKGFFLEPTLFVDVKSSMTIAQQEIFGPVGVVIPFGDDDEAVAIANDSQFGLSGAVWSANTIRAYDVASRLRTGTVWVNGASGGTNPYGPFGGYKRSGIGREFGEFGLEEYLETKTIKWGVAPG